MFNFFRDKMLNVVLAVLFVVLGVFSFKSYLYKKELENTVIKQEMKIKDLELENNNLKQTFLQIKDTLKNINFENKILKEKINVVKQIKGNKDEKNITIERDINITIP